MIVPDTGYLSKAHALLKEHGALLIADEVQTGLARTGRTLSQEWDGARVRPREGADRGVGGSVGEVSGVRGGWGGDRVCTRRHHC